MVSPLSSPAMPAIQHCYLLFYLYTDIRVWGSRGLIDHIRILPFQSHFSSFLGSGGCLGTIMFQVSLGAWQKWRCSDAASYGTQQAEHLGPDIPFEYPEMLSSLLSCGLSIQQTPIPVKAIQMIGLKWEQDILKPRSHWPDIHGSCIVHSLLCPRALWVSFSIYIMDLSVQGRSLCAYPEISTMGSCSLWPSRQDSSKHH